MEVFERLITTSARRPVGPFTRRRKERLTERAADEHFMSHALALARKGVGSTAPNPPVGAVVVKQGRIVGAGFHRRAGADHAEVEALRQAGAAARGATLYVTLEPCNHTGRTPPCCDAILAAGISHVVVATNDPNPITDGRGMARLRRAEIEVTQGVLEPLAQELIAPFRKAITVGLPLITAKIAQSLDGKIATSRGESRWISSAASRRRVQVLRREADAMLVGINTVLQDDPQLTVRGALHRADRPLRVIVDSRLRIPLRARCLSPQPPTLIATTSRAAGSRKPQALARRGIEVLVLPPKQGRVPLRRLCQTLAQRGIHSLLIEGGGAVLAEAFAERLIDRVVWFIAPIILGGRSAPGAVGGRGVNRLTDAIRLEGLTISRSGNDVCVEGRVVYPKLAHSRQHTAHRKSA